MVIAITILLFLVAITFFSACAKDDEPIDKFYKDYKINNTFGAVKYLDTIYSKKEQVELTSVININHKTITIDTELYPELNKPAIISFVYLKIIKSPVLRRNGYLCDDCKYIDYSNGGYNFLVPHFTTYTLDSQTEFDTFGNYSNSSYHDGYLQTDYDAINIYSFDANTSIVDDLSGYKKTLTLLTPIQLLGNSSCWSGDKCLYFNGINSELTDIKITSALKNQNFTMCLRVKPETLNDQENYIQNQGIVLYYISNKLRLYSIGDVVTSPDNVLTKGKWHQICATYNSSYAMLYINGTNVGGADYNTTITFAGPITISGSVGSANVNATVQCAQYWNESMFPKNISELYKHTECNTSFMTGNLTMSLNLTEHSKMQIDDRGNTSLASYVFYNDTGFNGGCLDFLGLGISIPSVYVNEDASIRNATHWSASVFVRLNKVPVGGEYYPVIYSESSTSQYYTISVYPKAFRLYAYNVTGDLGDIMLSIPVIKTQQWYHLVMTYDGELSTNNLKLYVNSTLVNQTELKGKFMNNVTLNQYKLYFGARLSSAGFNGSIDEVKIYNRTLTNDEIVREYNNFVYNRTIPKYKNVSTSIMNINHINKTHIYNITLKPFMYNGTNVDNDCGNEASSTVICLKLDSNGKDNSPNNWNYMMNGSFSCNNHGMINNSCFFNGRNSYFNYTSSAQVYDDAINSSTSLWLRMINSYFPNVDYQYIVAQQPMFLMRINMSTLKIECKYTNSSQEETLIRSDNAISTVTSNHVICEKNSTHVKMWVNGLLQNDIRTFESVLLTPPGKLPFIIGQNNTNAMWFYGYIDNLKIYNRTITNKDIERDYLGYGSYVNVSIRSSNTNTSWTQFNDCSFKVFSPLTTGIVYNCSNITAGNFTDLHMIFKTSDSKYTPMINYTEYGYNTLPIIDTIRFRVSNDTESNINCTVTYNDPDKDIITKIYYTWFNDSIGLITNEDNSTFNSLNFSKSNNYTCQVTLFDGLDNSTPLNISNNFPNITVSLTPIVAYINNTINATANYSDIDNDIGIVYFDWFINKTIKYSNFSTDISSNTNISSFLMPNNFSRWSNITIQVTPFDNISNGTKFNVSMNISNSHSIIKASIKPIIAYFNNTLNATANYTDLESDPGAIYFDWFVNNTQKHANYTLMVMDNNNISSLLMPSNFSKWSSVIVQITPFELVTDSNGTKTNISINISNILPEMTLSLKPTIAYSNTTINVTANYTDADLDIGVVYFDWFVNNTWKYANYTIGTLSNNNVSSLLMSNNFSKWSNIIVQSTPFDGISNGSKSNKTMNITNYQPYFISYNISSDANCSNKPVNVSVVVTDLDDNVGNIHLNWLKNNVTIYSAIESITFGATYNGTLDTSNFTSWDKIILQLSVDDYSLNTTLVNTTEMTMKNCAVVPESPGGGSHANAGTGLKCPLNYTKVGESCIKNAPITPPAEEPIIPPVEETLKEKIDNTLETYVKPFQENVIDKLVNDMPRFAFLKNFTTMQFIVFCVISLLIIFYLFSIFIQLIINQKK